MKVGEIIVKPPGDPAGTWVASVRVQPAWTSQSTTEDDEGYPAIAGVGTDAALAVKDLWKNIGRAYLGYEATKASPPQVDITLRSAWELIEAYARSCGGDINKVPDFVVRNDIDELLRRLGLT